ncbi:MAG: hypothetical protein JWN92_2854 [Candidatus Acidoferrum typicum]|jgi:hypothetical protein|nr:hypothetical protein [Candidatus Acidoferrum typicum]
MNVVDGTYGVERARMTGGPVSENTPTILLEQPIINENARIHVPCTWLENKTRVSLPN